MNISLRKSYTLLAIASLFYLYQFVLRLSPSVMMNELMEAFSIDATGFAALGSIALLSYSLFQIPLGAFADKFGVRKCILLFLSICILGTYVFATAPNLWVAQIGRFIIGLGSAAAFLSVSKIISQTIPLEKRSTMLGLTMVVGTIGALNGGLPLCYLMEQVGWGQTLLIMCMVGVALNILIYFTLKLPKVIQAEEKETIVNSFKTVINCKDVWTYGISAIGLYLSICVLGDLWGVAFIMESYGIERSEAVQFISILYIGVCVGSLTITWFSDLIQRMKSFIIFSNIMLLTLIALIISPISIPLSLLSPIFFLIGFFSGSELLCFSGACKSLPSSVAGLTTGFLNGIVMMTGAFIQFCVGVVLDINWNGSLNAEGIKLYSASDYRLALSLLLPVLFIALISSFFIQEKKTLTLLEKEI